MTIKAKSLADIFKTKKDGTKYVNHEFQVFGHFLASQMDVPKKEFGLFIRLAKKEDRNLLQKTLEFVKGVSNPKSKVKLFMWKLSKLKEEEKQKNVNKSI